MEIPRNVVEIPSSNSFKSESVVASIFFGGGGAGYRGVTVNFFLTFCGHRSKNGYYGNWSLIAMPTQDYVMVSMATFG